MAQIPSIKHHRKLLIVFVLAAIMLLLAFLGAWVIPIIMAACAITIGISIAVIAGNWNKWQDNMQSAIENAGETVSGGGTPDGDAIADAILDALMIGAFITLLIAVSILFLCLKAYTSIGSWVMDGAVDMATNMIITAFVMGAIATFVTGAEGKGANAEIVTKVLNEKISSIEIDWVSYALAVTGAVLTAIGLMRSLVDNTVVALMLSIGGLLLVLIGASIKGPEKIFPILVGFAMSVWGLLQGAYNTLKETMRGKKIFNAACTIVAGLGTGKGLYEYHEWIQEYST